MFSCPGCGQTENILATEGPPRQVTLAGTKFNVWSWDGTHCTPSIILACGHHTPGRWKPELQD